METAPSAPLKALLFDLTPGGERWHIFCVKRDFVNDTFSFNAPSVAGYSNRERSNRFPLGLLSPSFACWKPVPFWRFLSLFVCLATASVFAQQPRSTGETNAGIFGSLKESIAQPLQLSTFARFITMSEALPLSEDLDLSPGNLPERFQVFDQVVPIISIIPSLGSGKASIFDQLRTAVEQVQLGTLILSEQEKSDLDEANKLLYERPDGKQQSAAYLKYSEYEQKYNDLVKRLQASQNAAEKASIQSSFASLERDWSLFGKRAEISQALNVLAKFDTSRLKDQFESWSKLVHDTVSGDFSNLTLAFDLPSDWRSITLPIRTQTPLALYVAKEQNDIPQRSQAPKIKQVSLRIIRVPIKRPPFEHPFLSTKNWKFKNGSVISDGDPSTDSRSEICPRIVTELVVARSIELLFESAEEGRRFVRMVNASAIVTLGDLPIKGKDTSGVFLISRLLSLNSPYIIGVIATDFPRIPDPDTSLKWQ